MMENTCDTLQKNLLGASTLSQTQIECIYAGIRLAHLQALTDGSELGVVKSFNF